LAAAKNDEQTVIDEDLGPLGRHPPEKISLISLAEQSVSQQQF